MHRHGEWKRRGRAVLSVAGGRDARVFNVGHYARIVREKALLRNQIHATHKIQQSALEGEDGADVILDSAESVFLRWPKIA